MRHLINIIVEGQQWAPQPDECAEYASHYEGDNQDEKTIDFNWHFDPAFPIAKIDHPGADWMDDEINAKEEEGYDGYYDDMFDGPIEEPIVLHLDDAGMGHIWDGYHRTGASISRGLPTIPAVVGTRKSK